MTLARVLKRAVHEGVDLQFGTYGWRKEYGRYGREPVSIEVAEEGIQEDMASARQRKRVRKLESVGEDIDGRLATTIPRTENARFVVQRAREMRAAGVEVDSDRVLAVKAMGEGLGLEGDRVVAFLIEKCEAL